MTMTVEQALAGLNGWHRWNAWAAHFYVNGKQLCNTQHSYAEGGMARGLPPARPKPADLAASGVPYGKVCQRCAKLSAPFTSAAQAPSAAQPAQSEGKADG